MNVLGKLALSQIRRKKARTVITVLAVVLSSSLLTAVVNFAASGHAMLVDFLGEDYGVYGGAYAVLLIVPAIVLGLLIIAMSILVISNVFRMSAGERVAEFGVLKCAGATKEQICKTIMYESFFLSVLAVPPGVALGYVLSFLGIRVANGYMDELNVLVRAMMMQVTFDLSFTFSGAALIISVVISAGTVVFSALLPAGKAMKISALECIRSGGEGSTAKYRRGKRKIDGKKAVEYQLARRNTISGDKRMRSAVTALSFSIILFVTMSGLKEIADGISDYISDDSGYTVVADYTSNYENRINPETGRRESYYVQTIDNKLAEEITKKLEAYEGTEVFGCGQDYFTYVTVLGEQEITAELQEALEMQGEEQEPMRDEPGQEGAEQESKRKGSEQEPAQGQSQQGSGHLPAGNRTEYELEVEIIIIDEEHYKEICRKAGAEYGDAVLLNDYRYNDNGKEKNIVPLSGSISSLRLEKGDGSAEAVRIGGILEGEEIPAELIYPNIRPVRLVLPYAEVRGYNWMSSPEDENGYMAYAKEVLEKYFPQGGLNYGEAGFVCRVFGAQDFVKIMNIAIVIAFFFLYGFVFLLGLIGILNVMSTEMFHVRMRAREFAVLQSVGMTSKSLQKMLNLESVFCAGRALVTGLPAGMIIVGLMKYCVQRILPFEFRMPWGTIFGVMAAAFALVWGTVRVSLHALKDQNLIETIRMQK